jgi:uncharacterized RDD family membrane protein YckC
MSAGTDSPIADTAEPSYARFSRRLKGLLIDWIMFVLLMAGALVLASAMRSDSIGRYLGFSAITIFLLYEPVLVSVTGGTIGHYLTNLRVVDDRTKGNVGLLKAFARFAIKTLLGWYSFISMGFTRRHQAVHDLMTFSTVQIRDLAKAQPHQYLPERTVFDDPRMPSRMRRLVVILGYLLLIPVGIFIVGAVLGPAGLMVSQACLDHNYRCSTAERAMLMALGAAWILPSVLCIFLGWRGKLFGCRLRTPNA